MKSGMVEPLTQMERVKIVFKISGRLVCTMLILDCNLNDNDKIEDVCWKINKMSLHV